MRARRLIVLLALGALLTGCAVEPDAGWRPPEWPTARVSVVAAPEPLDPSALGELRGQRIRDDAIGVQARWMQLPGDAAMNARATAVVQEAIAQRTAQTGTGYAPTVHPRGAGMGDRACVRGSTTRSAAELAADPALGPGGADGIAVVCDIVTAAGTYLGQRMRTVSVQAGAIVGDTSIVLYTDTASGALATGGELWAETAPALLWEATVDAVRREHRSLSLAPVAAPDETALAAVRAALEQTLVAADGTLVFTLPAGFTAPELMALGVAATSSPLAIGVSPSAAALTPFGAGLVQAAAAAVPYAPPAPVAAGFERVDCDLLPCVAMTYDDGPSGMTAGILDELAARHAAASFFVLGQRVRSNADVLVRARAEGHDVENHSWNHPHLPELTDAQVRDQLRDTNSAVAAVTGTSPTAFRPPYGEYDAEVLAVAGMPAILWDVDTEDWQHPADDVLLARAVDQPQPGSIVLQHDIQENTARTAPAVYDGLLDRGFTLVNLRQLFGGALPASGVWRSAR